MSGLTRELRVNVGAFRLHAQRIVGSTPVGDRSRLCADVRADGYGHGRHIIDSLLTQAGFSHFLGDDGCTSPLDHHEHTVVDAELLYGVDSSDVNARGFTSLGGVVVNVKHVPAGQRISYGYTYSTSSPSTVALVALGYADGVPRRASNVADVHTGDVIGRVAGRVAMDQFVMDAGASEVSVGDEVTVWSSEPTNGPSLGELAQQTGIHPLAITCGVGFRVSRRAIDS